MDGDPACSGAAIRRGLGDCRTHPHFGVLVGLVIDVCRLLTSCCLDLASSHFSSLGRIPVSRGASQPLRRANSASRSDPHSKGTGRWDHWYSAYTWPVSALESRAQPLWPQRHAGEQRCRQRHRSYAISVYRASAQPGTTGLCP